MRCSPSSRRLRARPMLAAVALALAALLAGCSAGYTGQSATDTPTPTGTTPTPSSEDRIGWEDGYAAGNSLTVTSEDGLNGSEFDAVIARTTARVEAIRGAEFTGDVTVERVTREEYRERNVTFVPPVDRAADQRFEAAFMVGEDRNASRAVEALFGESVAGYYLPSEDRIVLVGERVDTRTLAHELVHALQHRQGWTVGSRDTLDGRLAGQGLTEGEAVVVTRKYVARCDEAWDCLPATSARSGNASAVVEYQGIYLTYRAPYVAGPSFIDALRAAGGWEAVTAAYERPPASTRELLDPSVYPADPPEVTVLDRARNGWERYGGTDSLGRTTVHAAFWANRLTNREDDVIATDYRDGYSRGLVADRFLAYRKGEADGYVWRLRFANASEAAEFVDGYERLLYRHEVKKVDERTYRVPDGPFADAFRVYIDGDMVTVVNAPAVTDLDDVWRPEGESA